MRDSEQSAATLQITIPLGQAVPITTCLPLYLTNTKIQHNLEPLQSSTYSSSLFLYTLQMASAIQPVNLVVYVDNLHDLIIYKSLPTGLILYTYQTLTPVDFLHKLNAYSKLSIFPEVLNSNTFCLSYSPKRLGKTEMCTYLWFKLLLSFTYAMPSGNTLAARQVQ